MAPPADSTVRLGLVGTGGDLVRAIETLKGIAAVKIAVVADPSDRSEGGKLAKSLQLPVVKNAMEVFRSDANIILEVNGDERQYERLLSVKPPGVEVMSIRGARLLIDLLARAGAGPGPAPAVPAAEPVHDNGRSLLQPLAAALREAMGKAGAPGDAVRALLPVVATTVGMDLAGVAVAGDKGFTWLTVPPEGGPLARLPAAELRRALGQAEPVWLTRPAKGLAVAALTPLRVGEEALGLLAAGRAREGTASPEDLTTLRLCADLLASAFRATAPPAPRDLLTEVPIEVIREVVKEVPVEVIREVPVEVPVEIVREVVREVPVEVLREVEVVREVPVEVIREVPVQVPVEVIKEVPVEVLRDVEVIREVLVEVPVEIVREVVREVPFEVVREVEVPVEAVREVEVVREVPVEVFREVPVEVVREVVKEVPVEVVREVIKEIVRDVPVEVERKVEVVREVPVEILREVIKEVPVPVEVIRETTQVDEEELRRLRRRLEELQTAYDQLATTGGRVPVDEKMQALLNMAGGVGHLFNNVLAGILGRTQFLLKRASREKSKELLTGLNEIEAATRMGIDALTRIQEFSRARPAEAFGPVDLNDIVQRAVEQTRPKWRDEPAAKGIRVELITHFGPHSRLIGAESELLEGVVQLINNAVEAMPRGGTLTIRTGLDSGRGVISVSDTGAGMPESARRRAFEPFFSTKGETGLGLGLSMVYGVMARHGGDAVVESEEGNGTTITLRVPTSGEGAPVQVTIPDAERQQVLLVDDDEAVRTALGDMLRGASYAVSLAASGLEGIARVRERAEAFDLVVTDLGMPDVPGWEVVEAVKQVDATTPVVIMSGFDRARATRRAKELGVDYVISKPFDIHDFLNTVKGLLLGRKRP